MQPTQPWLQGTVAPVWLYILQEAWLPSRLFQGRWAVRLRSGAW